MKIAILGSGGREHALALQISKSKKLEKLYCIPGNAGTNLIAENLNLKLENFNEIYNFIKCKDIDSHFVTDEVSDLPRLPRGGYGDHTKDHPYTARIAGRSILEDNQWILDDWETFHTEFFKLPLVVGVLPEQNQDVKVSPDGYGGIIVKNTLENRYTNKNGQSYIWEYNDGEKSYPVTKFPLKRIDWYHSYEEKLHQQLVKAISPKVLSNISQVD